MSDNGFFSPTGVSKFDGQSLVAGQNGNIEVYDVTNGAVLAKGATTVRTLAARFADVFSVEDFGVVDDPNGARIAENTAAYQAAINAASGVARLRHRAGLYIVHNGISVPANVDMELDGTLFLASGANATCVNITGSNVFIRGQGTIDGNSSKQTATHAGIGGDSINNIVVQGVIVQNTINWPFNITRANNCFAIECEFLNGGNSVEYAISGDNCWFIRCKVDNINDLGVGHYGGFTNSGTIGCRVTNCSSSGPFSFNDSAQTGIPTSIIISENIVSLCGSGILVASNVGSGTGPLYTKVSNNICFANNGPGISCTANEGLSVVDNTLQGNNTTATAPGGEIEIGELGGTVTGALVANNLILNPGGGAQAGYGIKIYLPNQTNILGNTILDLRATPAMISGLFGPTGQHCFTDGNIIYGATGAPDGITYGYFSTQGFYFKSGTNGTGGTLSGSPLLDGMPAFINNAAGQTSGFQAQGLSFGWNLSGGLGECDIIGAGGTNVGSWNGLFFHGVDKTGARLTGPMSYGAYAKIDGSGNIKAGAGFQLSDTGPTWTQGGVAPSGTATNGSLYSNYNGAAGSTLYVYAGGAWKAVA